jgi:alpha-tubulin suppressor-like RCC1 family protein
MRTLPYLTLGLLMLGGALGCGPGSRNLRWEFEFGDAASAARAQVVVGRIRAGGCDSGTVVYEAEAARGQTPSMPPVLAAGRYGFEGVARDADCTVFLRGCVEVDVPREDGEVVLVNLLATTESSACSAAMCSAGRCDGMDAGVDGGSLDAGMDASFDGGPFDGGGLDGGSDGGVDAGRDAGSDAPTDAGVPRVVTGYVVGTAFGCATSAGALHCWGGNLAGQLGLGTSGAGTERSVPTRVGSGTTWSTLGAGDEHICGTLGTDLFCWGDNMDGQIGTGDMVNRPTPTRAGTVVGPFDVIDGASLGDHTCVLRPTGVLACIGQNDYGQLGLADNVTHLAFGAWTGTYRAMSAGHHFTCGVRTDGALLCTGRNLVGQLGLGVPGDVNAPTLVGAGLDWVGLGAGDTHVCGLRGTGELWCWGQGTSGRLGNGMAANVNAPTRIGTGTNWTAVSAGGAHTCGLRGTGELWCWGANDDGQLGLGTTGAAVTTPMRVGTATDWSSVRAGGTFTCGQRGSDLYCWGSNAVGQLGLGDTTPRSTPTLVRIY